MSEVLAIFEKIDQIHRSTGDKDGEKYKMYFSPYSTGYTQEDFLFLKTSEGSISGSNALNFTDEAYDFSKVANNIPRSENGIWELSGSPNHLLYNNYREIVKDLEIIDPTVLKIESLYESPLFLGALKMSGKVKERETYSIYFNLYFETFKKIKNLENEISNAAKDIEIELEKEKLTAISQRWNSNGYKKEIEDEIITIFEKELNRFVMARSEAKSRMYIDEETAMDKADFFFTSCYPNNLYNADKLSWSSIVLEKEQINSLLQNANSNYIEIVKGTELENLELQEITFELLFVEIVRPWFDENLLLSPFWNLKVLNAENYSIPRYPTKLVFIRNVSLKLKPDSKKNEAIIKSQVENSKSIKGPFSLNFSIDKKSIGLFNQKMSLNLIKKQKIESVINRDSNVFTNRLLIRKDVTKNFLLTFNASTGESINPVNAVFYVDGKVYKTYKKVVGNSIQVSLPANKSYTVELNDDNYLNDPIEFSYSPKDEKLDIIARNFIVSFRRTMIRRFPRKDNNMKFEIRFQVEGTNDLLDPTDSEFFSEGQVQKISKQVTENVMFVSLKKGMNYTLKFISDMGYINEEYSLSLTKDEKMKNEVIKRVFMVKPIPQIINETKLTNGEFLLLGVVCKQLPKIPNPII